MFKRRKLKCLIVGIMIMICVFVFNMNVNAATNLSTISNRVYDENLRISTEIQEAVDDGILPSFHASYKYNYYYQSYFVHMKSNNILSSLASFTEEQVRTHTVQSSYITQIEQQIINNNYIYPANINKNKSLGFYYDGDTLYFIWSSYYLPNSYINIKEISVTYNGQTYIVENEVMTSSCSYINGDSKFELSMPIYYSTVNNLQINVTPLAFYIEDTNGNTVEGGLSYDLDSSILDHSEIKVNYWVASLDELQVGEGCDTDNYYTFKCTQEESFNLIKPCTFNGTTSITHSFFKYEYVTDLEVRETSTDYQIYFPYASDLSTINHIDLIAKFTNDNTISTILVTRTSDSIQTVDSSPNHYITVLKETYGTLSEIGLLKISFYDNASSQANKNYDTLSTITSKETMDTAYLLSMYNKIWEETPANTADPSTTDPVDNTNPNNQTDPIEDVESNNPGVDNTNNDSNNQNNVLDENTNQDTNNSNNDETILDKIEDKINQIFDSTDEEKTDQALKIVLCIFFSIILLFIIYKVIVLIRKIMK